MHYSKEQVVDSISVFPNPFCGKTNVQFDVLQAESNFSTIYNSLGAIVATVIPKTLFQPGSYSIQFGDGLTAGVYFTRVKILTIKEKNFLLKG